MKQFMAGIFLFQNNNSRPSIHSVSKLAHCFRHNTVLGFEMPLWGWTMTIDCSAPRRKFSQGIAAVSLAAIMAPLAAHGQTVAPVRIGVLASLTGSVADVNAGQLKGLRLRVKQLGGRIAGRTVELVVEDDAGDPNTGVVKAQKLIERDRVDVLVGPFLGHVMAAIQDYVGRKGVPTLPLVGQTPENVRHANIVVPSWNSAQLGRMMGEYAVKKLGHRNAVIVSSKYSFGTRVSEGFRAGFTAAGGKVRQEVYVPLGTADWAPFIGGLPEGAAMFSAVPGADAIKLVKTRHEFGQRDSLPLLGPISTVDGMLLPAMGEAALGTVAVTHYLDDIDIPENVRFIEDFRREYGQRPTGYYEALGYTIGLVIEAALRATRGRSEPAILLPALKAVDIPTPQGRLRFDPDKRYPYLDYYFVKVADKGGKPAYRILDVLRNVRPD